MTELVKLPRSRAPRGAELVRLRLPDRPGSLAAVAAHLAAYGVDVLRLEVVDRGSATAIDDLLLSGPKLSASLAELGSRAMVLARRPGVDLRDPGLAMADACETVASAEDELDLHARLLRAAVELVFAEAAFVCVRRDGGILAVTAATVAEMPSAADGSGASLITSALFSGEPLTADGRAPWAPITIREVLPEGSVVVVPSPAPHAFALALVREDSAPYAAAELERLGALMRVAVASLRGGGTRAGHRPSLVGEFQL